MALSEKKKGALKTAAIALIVGFLGDYADVSSKVIDFLLSLF